MILLDTNIISELLKPKPDHNVETWLASQPAATVFISSITEAELRFGAAIMPQGKRRKEIEAGIESMLTDDFPGRVLPFDQAAAVAYATIAADRRSAGRPISQFDGQIAAIARSRGASVATRNVTDFDGCGVIVFNPWNAIVPP